MKTAIPTGYRSIKALLLMAIVVPCAYAAKFHLLEQDGNGDQRSSHKTVTVQIWDTAMVMRTQFEFTGPTIVLAGYQFPGRGAWTMIVFEGNREVWRRQVGKDTGDGDGPGALVIIPSGR